jgi:cellulose biosynthesis protein BcsQ
MNPLLTAPLALFADGTSADAASTWTNKEVLLAIGAVIGAIIPVVLFIVKAVMGVYRTRIRNLVAERNSLQQQLDTGQPPDQPPPAFGELEKQLAEAQSEVTQLKALIAEHEDNTTSQLSLIDELRGNLASVQGALGQHEEELKAERRRIDRALSKGGETWNEKILARQSIDFKGLEPDGRRTPILSVLNLKGGVGKTTITANLAAALDRRGYRVLVLDLDLQGSLTGLFLPEARQVELFNAGCLLEDFLTASFGAEFPSILHYTQPILPVGEPGSECRSGLVPTSDSLAYAEMNLTIRWLLREGNRDVRLLLRRELLLKRVTNLYDIILLDCPPLINVCCVNALAASDYLLIPVMPSKQATARVPVLLRRLREFRDNINPDLKVMGIVPNRTLRTEGLTYDEQSRLTALQDQCRDVWGEPVCQFDRFIPQSTQIRCAEDENRTLTPADEMFQVFLDLAKEVEDRLPTFCRPSNVTAGVVS